MPARFLTLDDVAEELALTRPQVLGLIRVDGLPAIRIGAQRGQWRVERSRLESWLQARHDETVRDVAAARDLDLDLEQVEAEPGSVAPRTGP